MEADVVINNNNIDLSIEIEDHEEAKDYHLFDFQCDIMKQQVEQRQRAEAIMKIENQRYQNRLRKFNRQKQLLQQFRGNKENYGDTNEIMEASRLLAEKYNELRDKLNFQAEEYGKWKSELKRQDELIEITIYEIDLIEDAIEKRLVDKTCLHPIYPFFLLK